jgi:tetratricopeptide (TPR) repeat protein
MAQATAVPPPRVIRPRHARASLLLAAVLLAAACVPQTTGQGTAAPRAAVLAEPDRQLALAHRRLGLGLEEAGDIAGAVDELTDAAALGGWTPQELGAGTDTPYSDLARICARPEPAEPAVRACTVAIASYRFSPERLARLLVLRGDAHRRLDRRDQALADYDTALEIETSNARALAGRGMVRAREGAYTDAVADLRRAVGSGADTPEVRFARAGALAALGRYEDAAADYDELLSSPEGIAAYPDAYRLRAEAHCRLGEADAAAVGWQVWLAAVPGGPDRVQDMLWALGYLRGPMAADFSPTAIAALRAWTRDGCPGA